MRTKMFALAVVGVLAAASLVACSDDGDSDAGAASATGTGPKGGNGTGKVGVILPDTISSPRWGTDDPKFLKEVFDSAGVPVDIQNAQGDKARFASLADDMIAGGAKVLILATLDAASGKAVIDKAKAQGIPTIDYDRLTLNGGASYYVSFDNLEVGRMQGRGLQKCLTDLGAKAPVIADLNGSPTDNNAIQAKQGYESVLQPLYDDAVYRKGPDQSVDDWSSAEAGVIFEQMMNQTGNKINGVLAANDGMANAAIAVLRKNGMNGKVPVTGQDATVQGLQNILLGDQCMTVYKPIAQEARAAANLAVKLFKGQKGADAGLSKVKDPESGGYVPAQLLKPKSVSKDTIKDVIADGFVKRGAVCTGDFKTLCDEAGV